MTQTRSNEPVMKHVIELWLASNIANQFQLDLLYRWIDDLRSTSEHRDEILTEIARIRNRHLRVQVTQGLDDQVFFRCPTPVDARLPTPARAAMDSIRTSW